MVRVRLVHHKKIQISGDKREKLSDLSNNDQCIQFYQTCSNFIVVVFCIPFKLITTDYLPDLYLTLTLTLTIEFDIDHIGFGLH